MSRFARVRALATFEVRQQLREPLTALYALVFLLLTLGFTSSGAVELVGARGTVPRTSEWSLWLAFGGLTAFGQVITTMVAVTAVLRDDAVRVTPQLVTAGVRPGEWLAARLLAAAFVLLAVYLAMPVGASFGAQLGADEVPDAPARIAKAYLVLTLPSMLVVAALVGVTAAMTRRVLAALAASLLLVGLWQFSLSLESDQATRTLGAWLDPFGNAPVLAETRGWSEAERTVRAVPRGGLVLQNRLIWVTVAIATVSFGLRRVRWDGARVSPWSRRAAEGREIRSRETGGREIGSHVSWRSALARRLHWGERRTTNEQAAPAIARFTAAWVAGDGGWQVVAWLAAANALLNAWAQSGDHNLLVGTLEAVRGHARIFLILLATVYAGELVWRDRDVRIDALIDTMPVSTRVMALGRLLGVAFAQWRVVAWLSLGALGIALWRGLVVEAADVVTWLVWTVWHVWAPFLQWTVLSLAVHVVVRHKVGAHLTLITGWVVAVVLDRTGADGWWYRYAEPASLTEGSGLALAAVLQRGAYWMLAALLLLPIIVTCWPRGATSRR
jgi:ABC-2 type transport system permease protein